MTSTWFSVYVCVCMYVCMYVMYVCMFVYVDCNKFATGNVRKCA